MENEGDNILVKLESEEYSCLVNCEEKVHLGEKA